MTDVDDKSPDQYVGRTLVGEFGRYRVTAAIGAGGMGSVTKAVTEGNGREVAIKFLHQELSSEGSSSRDRFEREIRVLSDLKAFRGIVQIEDWGQSDGGQLFLVMEFVAAPTLDKVIADNPQGLPQMKAVQIVTEILSVLEPIHHRKFVHRDLKPHNICVYDSPLAVRLLDFGLSKPYQEGLGYQKVTKRMQGKGNEIPGSPHYMAVEQFLRPSEVDERTDLYAVGIILYELLAGIPPFRGIYLQDILKQHKETEPPPIDQCVDGGPISYRLQAVIEKALSKKQESRYQTAGEFKEALFDILNVLNKQRRPKKDLDGRYRILKKIGQGGNSEVFEAQTTPGGERVAMKIAREGASDWDEETLMNEADRALNHENIVKVIEFGQFEGRPALVMEFLDGGTLEDVMTAAHDQGLGEAVFYRTIIDVCRGLHHAHQSNIVHRDVKPGNMLRTGDGRTKVCDFGIAKRFEQSGDEVKGAKNTTLAKGTAQYISPEQCDLQGRVDRRADIYSLGVMIYEMLAGKLPFTEGILIMQHLQQNPPPLEVKGKYRNPDELCKVVERCMQKRPEDRFQSMKDLAQELVRVSKLEPQKKAHKAVAIDTIPAEWKTDPSRSGLINPTAGGTGTAMMPTTGGGKRGLVVGVPIVLVAIIAAVVYLKNDSPAAPINPNTPPVVDPAQAARDEAFNEVLRLTNERNWVAISTADLSPLADHPEDKQRLSLAIEEKGVRDVLGANPANADEWQARAADCKSLSDVLRLLGGSDEKCGALADLAAKAADVTAPDADGGFLDWRDEPRAALTTALDRAETTFGLAQGYGRGLRKFLDDAALRRLDENLLRLAARFDGGGDTDEIGADVKNWLMDVLARAAQRGVRSDTVLRAFRAWTEKRATSRPDPIDGIAFVIGPAAALAALGREDVFGPALDDARADRGRTDPRSLGAALASAVVAVESRPEFAAAVVSRFGAEVADWAARSREFESRSGLPLGRYRDAIADALAPQFTVGSAVHSALVARATAMDARQFTDAVDVELESFVAELNPSASRRARMRDAWETMTAEWRKSDAALDWAKVQSAVQAFDGSTDRSQSSLDAQFNEMRTFVSRHPDDENARTLRDRARRLLDELKAQERWMAVLLLVRGHASLVGDADRAASAARAGLAAALAKSVQELSFTHGLEGAARDAALRVVGDANRLNANWAALDRGVLRFEIAVPASERDLVNEADFQLASTEGVNVTWIDGRLVITVQPRLVTTPAPTFKDGSLAVAVPLRIGSEKWSLATEELIVELPGPTQGDCDFSPPAISCRAESSAGAAPRLNVIVTDDRPAPAGGYKVTATLGGRELPAPTQGALTPSLDTFSPGPLEILEIRAEDEAGNVVVSTGEWQNDLGRVRQALVYREADVASENARAMAAAFQTRVLEAKTVDELKNRIATFSGTLQMLARHDDGADDTPVRDLAQSLGSIFDRFWQEAPDLQRLDGVANAFTGLVTALRDIELAATGESTWSPRLREGYDAARGRALELANRGSESNPGGGKPIDPTPPKPVYKKVERVSAFGFDFVRVETDDGEPAWIATQEVSVDRANALFPDLVKEAKKAAGNYEGISWNLAGRQALCPISPNMALDAVESLRAKSTSELNTLAEQLGGPVDVGLPTSDQWEAAARLQAGGRSTGYIWGDSNLPSVYAPRTPPSNKNDPWFDWVRTVDEDGTQPFQFLASNVCELVHLRPGSRSLLPRGGSLRDVAKMTPFKIENREKTMSGKSTDLLSGMRLAIVPRN